MTNEPLTVIIAEGLDASTNGKGFDARHQKAFQLANAAPDLLAALKDVCGFCAPMSPRGKAVVDAARAIIAKAEGKQ